MISPICSFKDAKDLMVRRILAHPLSVAVDRFEVNIGPVDLLPWLAQQDQDVKVFWSDQNNHLMVAAIGVADEIIGNGMDRLGEDLERAGRHPQAHYYGGICFDPGNIDGEWRDFGVYRFVLPLFEVVKTQQAIRLCCNIKAADETTRQSILAHLVRLDFTAGREAPLPGVVMRKDFPDFSDWQNNVAHVLKSIAGKNIAKVVLARKTVFTFDQEADACGLLKELEKLAPASSRFLFQFSRDTVFFGASPERLYCRRGRYVESEAIAGTRPRGATDSRDLALKKELLASPKDAVEHQLVLSSIRESLNGHCVSLKENGSPEVLALNRSYHLRTCVQGTLKQGIKDGDLLSGLHPTPAVAGVPKDKALHMIKTLEPFSRGWFAGAVACLGHEAVDFIVAIRSALVHGRTMNVYAGAGIVEGSVARNEWEEIDNKIENLLKVIGKRP